MIGRIKTLLCVLTLLWQKKILYKVTNYGEVPERAKASLAVGYGTWFLDLGAPLMVACFQQTMVQASNVNMLRHALSILLYHHFECFFS